MAAAGEEVVKLVFLCVPGDGAGRRPRKGMVPLVAGESWAQFETRVARRLQLRAGAPAGVYAWDGGPRISSVEGLLDVDEGRTLVVLDADGNDNIAAAANAAGASAALAAAAGGGARAGRAGATDGVAHAYRPSSACGSSVRARPAAESTGGSHASAGTDSGAAIVGAGCVTIHVSPADGAAEAKRATRARRAADGGRRRESGGAGSTRAERAAAARTAPLSVRRVALLAAVVTFLGTFSLWMTSMRGAHVLERIRERSARPGGGFVRAPVTVP
ncbi:hypothetical protein KFE25_013228 [Diacronema lutheri]|uniref:Uncharacterized protein n=1 Tax=Diacronema lutheri TaxID=2081491 RepID=A0A8J5X7I8_DIALT|nr:hypothetical protein KFE25_013228 [Diacronema lutheri]